MMCREALAGHDGPVLVVAGDSPMMQRESIRALLDEFEREPAGLPAGHGAQGRSRPGWGGSSATRAGEFVGIVEEKDATRRATNDHAKSIMSCYVFDGRDLLVALDQIRADNAQGEYYLTDCPGVLLAAGKDVRALPVLKPCEALSINNDGGTGRSRSGDAQMRSTVTVPSVMPTARPRLTRSRPPMNDLKIFSGRANRELARRICDYLGLPLGRHHDRQLSRRRDRPARSTRTSAAATCSSCSRPARRSTRT